MSTYEERNDLEGWLRKEAEWGVSEQDLGIIFKITPERLKYVEEQMTWGHRFEKEQAQETIRTQRIMTQAEMSVIEHAIAFVATDLKMAELWASRGDTTKDRSERYALAIQHHINRTLFFDAVRDLNLLREPRKEGE